MCTLLFAYKLHPNYRFIFLGNRDEFKSRPALKAHFWESHPNVLAGIDLEKGGTWTGITQEGRFAFITNYRDFSIPRNSILSRGYLTRDFLVHSVDPLKYLQDLKLHKSNYDPFNLIVGNPDNLWFYSNIEDMIRPIKPGIYGLSNALLDTPWYKVSKAKKRFAQLLATDFSSDQLFEILDDTEIAPDEVLPKTGVPLDTERMLSTIHIDTENYGTRFKTVILVDNDGKVQFYEKALNEVGHWELSTYTFKINEQGKNSSS